MTGNDRYYLDFAMQVGQEKGSCDRLRTGTVIVRHGATDEIVSIGYNTSPDGMSTCDEVGHLMFENHCVATLHGEMVAVGGAVKRGNSINGCTAYISHTPCLYCAKLLIAAGIKKVMYLKEYGSPEARAILDTLSIKTKVPIQLYL